MKNTFFNEFIVLEKSQTDGELPSFFSHSIKYLKKDHVTLTDFLVITLRIRYPGRWRLRLGGYKKKSGTKPFETQIFCENVRKNVQRIFFFFRTGIEPTDRTKFG